ncbi:MAG: cytidylate kinase-like family protein, partial [Proteobacteria bacterium]|nr:cytidylate kinase-like family protein [Pseudomonadota bacterium]
MAVITISRQFGAGGKTLGRRIADRLGYYYADEDIIEQAVVDIHKSSDRIEIIELKRLGKLQQYIAQLIPFGKSLM